MKSVSSVLGDYMRLALKESVESIGLNFEFLHSRNEQINKFSLPKKIRTGCIKILKAGASEIESEQINAPKTYEDFFSTPSFKNSRRFFFRKFVNKKQNAASVSIKENSVNGKQRERYERIHGSFDF